MRVIFASPNHDYPADHSLVSAVLPNANAH